MSHIFYKILKKIREESPYTQQEVADLLGISIKQYQNYESKTLPPHDKILKLNEIFKTNLSTLIYQEKVPAEVIPVSSNTEAELWAALKREQENMGKAHDTIRILIDKDPPQERKTKNG